MPGAAQMERRERLRKLLAQQEVELAEAPAIGQIVVEQVAQLQVCSYRWLVTEAA